MLTGFGPCEPGKEIPSWVGKHLGAAICGSLAKFAEMGNGRPLVYDLSEALDETKHEIGCVCARARSCVCVCVCVVCVCVCVCVSGKYWALAWQV